MSNEILDVVKTGIAGLQAQVEKQSAKILELQQKSASFGNFAGAALPRNANDIIVKLSADPALNGLRDRSQKQVILRSDAAIAEVKNTVVGDGSSSVGLTANATRATVFGEHPTRKLTLLDALPRLAVFSGSFEFERLDNYLSAAAYQATEGSAKAQTSVPSALQTSAITTIAHFVRASEQVLSDQPALQMMLGTLLSYGVLRKLENEIVAGSTSGKIQGLATVATAFAPSASSGPLVDSVGEMLTALDIEGWNAGLIVLHPNDWHSIRSERNAQSSYVASGWNLPAAPSIWGVPVVTSPACAEGHPIAFDPSQTVLLDRQQATVEVGRSGDDFTENVLTLRGELRAGLAVFSPSAVLRLA
ncbi:MAG: phage major capsid protein [Xanthomonadales bacterium]|nr:phage major capsid protein [Xanthomonadales bacterium]